MFDLSGKRVLVTGASSGLGEHFARLLASRGANVLLAARRLDSLDRIASEIRLAGGKAETVPLDVMDPASIRALGDKLGALDVLINNAGIGRPARALDQSETDWDDVINTNLKGVFLVAQLAGRAMRDSGRGGAIVNIASILGLRQTPGVISYTVSKAGVIQMTKTLALELARFNIRVNALAPGYIATDLNRSYWETEPGREILARMPMRRLGELEDLDGPLLLLASDEARFMTGSVLVVDGGHLVSTL